MSERVRPDRESFFDLGKFGESPHNCYCLKLCMGTVISWVGGGLMIYEVLIVVM